MLVSIYFLNNREAEGGKRTGTSDGLAITLILHITSGKHTLEAGHAGTGLGDDVALVVEVDLALEQSSGRVVTDGVEEAVGVDGLLLAGDGVLDAQVGHQAAGLVLAQHLDTHGVPADVHLGVLEEALGHGLAGAEGVATDQHGDTAAVLGQEHGLLGGGVATTDHVQGLVAEDGHGAVTHGAGADAVLPVLLLAGEVQATGVGARGDDDRVGGVGGLVVRAVVPLRPQLEGPLRQVDLGDGLGDDLGAEPGGLLAHLVHQLGATDAVGETGEVLNVGGGGQLATGGGAVRQHAFVHDGLQFRSRQVDGGGVGGGAGPDDWRGYGLASPFLSLPPFCKIASLHKR